jgi:hypothetical protein
VSAGAVQQQQYLCSSSAASIAIANANDARLMGLPLLLSAGLCCGRLVLDASVVGDVRALEVW